MIIAVLGPTGVGKTKLSIELAKKYNGIVINCDAMQVYKGLNIGTAKIKEEEKENIKHFLFDIREVNEEYSVYNYQKDVRKLLEEYKDKNIILVGGTGLYLKAALYNYKFEEENNTKPDYSKYNNDELYEMVLKKDPNTKIHKNNRIRLERFLSKETITNEPCTKLYDFILIGLTTSRETLYDRINKRVDIMLSEGLEQEARYYYDNYKNEKVLSRGIGYKELFKYFDKEITKEEAIDLIKKNSRHYAKRQYTFFNNQFDMKWFDVNFNNFNETVNEIINYIERQ